MEQASLQTPHSIYEASRVSFYPLFLVPPVAPQEEWRVGLEGSSLAIELPEEGVRGIQHLQAGKSVAETAAALWQEFGEAVDTIDLVQGLADLGFVARVDAHVFPSPEIVGQRWLQAIPSAAVAWLYSWPALLIAGVVILVGPILLLADPAVRPRSQDLLWSSSYSLDIIVLVVISPILILKHELGHLLAARAKGLSGELTFGHRLFYLVAVSHIGGIWKFPRLDRMIIYCAGMASDCVTASICLLVIFISRQLGLFLPGSLESLLRLLALSEYLALVWEFQIFLKTDVYHIVSDLTNRHDLPSQAAAVFHSGWRRLFRRRGQCRESAEQHFDLLTVSYAALSLIGIGGSILWGTFYLIPATFTAIHNEIAQLGTGMRTMNLLAALDSVVGLALEGLYLFLLGWSIIRTHRSRMRHRETGSEVQRETAPTVAEPKQTPGIESAV
jgi:putative peptide zinc metalloprotease protein